MIVNLRTNSELDTITRKLEESEFEFYLTGSRFFKTMTPSSDYDYFVQTGKGVVAFLDKLGFELDNHGDNYSDQSVLSVWKHPLYAIHIQTIRSDWMRVKIQTQLILKELHERGYLTKDAMSSKHTSRRLWELFCNTLKNFETATRKEN